MLTALDVAKYFLALANEDEEQMSNLKLQKLLYYAQGFHLAIFDKPLFSDYIEAWTHGPVVVSIYHTYKENGSKGIPHQEDVDLTKFDEETKQLLDEVYSVYGQYAAWALREFTHNEPPWVSTSPRGIISLEALSDYFKTQIVDA